MFFSWCYSRFPCMALSIHPGGNVVKRFCKMRMVCLRGALDFIEPEFGWRQEEGSKRDHWVGFCLILSRSVFVSCFIRTNEQCAVALQGERPLISDWDRGGCRGGGRRPEHSSRQRIGCGVCSGWGKDRKMRDFSWIELNKCRTSAVFFRMEMEPWPTVKAFHV